MAPVLWPDVDRPVEMPTMGRSQRQLGAFYTPSETASYMARWAVRRDADRVLEPSMGDGQFLRAVAVHAERLGVRNVELWGVELDPITYRATVAGGVVEPERAIVGDFLQVDPFPVDVVIGNPPYVRLRHLPQCEADLAKLIGSHELGTSMDPAGSVWLPFVTHATQFLAPGGRLAFILPLDLTYVRYAKPLWRFLGRNFGNLRLLRVHDRLFPEILQDVVMLLADDRGSTSTTVEFECFDRRSDLLDGEPSARSQVALARIASDDRPFMEALLPSELRTLLSGKLRELTRPLSDRVTWNIGYVTGDKSFFHPDAEAVARYGLPENSLVPAISSGRRATKHGLMTSALPTEATELLFLPGGDVARLSDSERAYVEFGQGAGVDRRYKCRIRDPWFVTPGVRKPDLVMPVFADLPVLLVNDGTYAASNSMLAGYLGGDAPLDVAASWYTSLTLLQIELAVHSLGGGVLVMVPREAGAIRTVVNASRDALPDVDRDLRHGAIDQAYRRGDIATLQGVHRLATVEIDLIREGIDELRRWRRGARGRSRSS